MRKTSVVSGGLGRRGLRKSVDLASLTWNSDFHSNKFLFTVGQTKGIEEKFDKATYPGRRYGV